MNTQRTRTPALVATAAVLACFFVSGCGTETAAPASDTGVVKPKTANVDPPGTHKKPPDFMP